MEPSPVSPVPSTGKEPDSTSTWRIAPERDSSVEDSQGGKWQNEETTKSIVTGTHQSIPNSDLPTKSLARGADTKDVPAAGAYMTVRERIDFVILAMLFGVLFAG